MRLVHLATPRRSLPVRPFCALSLALCLASLLCLGCTRNFFRQRADKEVDSILNQKDKYPQWAIEQYHVYPDPRARFADPTNPNRPPMPPDDPAAKKLSPNPQKPQAQGRHRLHRRQRLPAHCSPTGTPRTAPAARTLA